VHILALAELLRSFGRIEQAVAEEELHWRSTFLFRSLAELPVTLSEPFQRCGRR
jgi:hypothetical protein